MIRNITVDGEDVLAVDTAEELGRALLTGRYVVASDAVRAAYGLTDTDNSDTQDIVDESDWRDDAWRAEGGTDGLGASDAIGADTRVESRRLSQRVCRQAQRTDVLQLSKSGKRAIGRVGRAPSHAATSNKLLMN